MKKLNFTLLIIVFALGVTVFVLFREWKSIQQEYNSLNSVYENALKYRRVDTIPVLNTVIDTVAGTTTITYLPTNTTADLSGYVSKGVADTMAMALNVAVKELQSVKEKVIILEAKGKGQRHIDTVTNTEWLVLKNDPSFNVKVNLSNDSIFPSVKLRLTQAYAPYKKNFFSRTEYRSVIRASDSRVQISEIVDLNKVPKSSRWGLSFFGGPIMTSTNLSYGVGLGLSYDLIQF